MRLAELHIPAVPMEIEQPANTHPATQHGWNDTSREGVRIRTWCGELHLRVNVAMYARRAGGPSISAGVELIDPANILNEGRATVGADLVVTPRTRPFCEKCKEAHVHHVLKNDSEQPKEEIPF